MEKLFYTKVGVNLKYIIYPMVTVCVLAPVSWSSCPTV